MESPVRKKNASAMYPQEKLVAETFHISQLIKHVREQMRVRGDALGPPVSTRACILLEMS